jgi:uncharacterized membrane protein
MFDWPLDWFSLALAIGAFILALKAFNRTDRLRARLDALESAKASAAARSMPPPLQAREGTLADSPPAPTPQQPPALPDDAATPIAAATIAQQAATAGVAPPPLPPPAPAEPGFEERIGTRWVVWIGGLTLALGGFFLVRYSIEAGLLGPGVRTILSGLFALTLLMAGEWTRRQQSIAEIEALPIANIPAILTAAGTAVAFATVYAAYALCDFLAPAAAFILLGLVALGTLAAALLHGPALAGLGIAAGFVTPVLVSSAQPDYWALYIYLAMVTAAAFALARARLWRWLAITTIAFAVLWTFPCLDCGPSMIGPHLFHVIAGFVLAALLVVTGFAFGPAAGADEVEPVSSGALAAYLFGALMIVLSSHHADAAMIGFALLVAGVLFVAWRTPAAASALGAASIFIFAVFIEWAVRAYPDWLVVPGGPMPGIGGPAPTAGSVSLHLVTAAIFAIGFGVTGFQAQARFAAATITVRWAAAGVFTPLALLVALYARISHLDRSIPFALFAVLLGAIFGAATEILTRREQRPGQPIAVALFATGTLGALALALTFALEKGWLSIALALMSMGAAWISVRRPIPFMRSLAAILAAIVTARIAYEPRIAGDAVGATPIFNWLLWGYGVPAASFWAGGHFLRRQADDAPQRAVDSAAILFTMLLAFMEIRHAVNGGDVYRVGAGLTEIALQVCVALALAIGLERLRIRTNSPIHNIGAVLLTVFAGLATVFGLLLLENPLVWLIDVGGRFLNVLLLGYAVPAILALLLSYAVAGRRPRYYGNTIAAGALILALSYVSFEIRRLYHGPVIGSGETTGAEQYSYSVAWLMFGVVLLGVGIFVNSERARLASAAVIALTILKAFLVDMSTLTGVYRALSFICLGLVLVGIGWLYQRMLFRRRTAPPAEPAMRPQA